MPTTGYSRRFIAPIIGSIISFGYNKWSNSWRSDVKDIDRLDQLLDNGEKVILVSWHGKFIPLFAMLEGHEVVILTSDSFRGDIISKICQRLGYQPSLIPPGGQGNAYRHLQKTLKTATLGAFAIDGPLGPNKQAKPGAIKLASKLGYLIVPISMACDKKRIMTGRWDQRELPHWGSTVALAIGDPLRVPPGLRAFEIDDWVVKVTNALNELDQRVEAKVETLKVD